MMNMIVTVSSRSVLDSSIPSLIIALDLVISHPTVARANDIHFFCLHLSCGHSKI